VVATVVLIVHLLVCGGVMLVVLLQAGKGAGLAGVFGAGGGAAESSVFGAKGAGGFLSKMTTAIAVIFMISSLGLTILKNRETMKSKSLMEEEVEPTTEEVSQPIVGDEGKTTKLPQDEQEK